MAEIEVWTLIVMVIGLIISVITLGLDLRKTRRSLKVMGEMVVLYKRQVELLQASIPAHLALEKERLELQKKIHDEEQKWKGLMAVGKIIEFFAENSD